MKILFLDDHRAILNLMGNYLEEILNAEILRADSISEFMRLNQDVDIYIIDLSLDEGSGFDILDTLSNQKNKKVIVYTSNMEPGVIKHLYNLKIVRGVVNKSSSESELVKAVRSVLNGNEFLCITSNRIINSSRTNYYDLSDELAELTTREREIVNLIWQNLSTEEIANRLYVSPLTINNHRKNIKKKLGADSLISILKISFKKGYINNLT